MVDDKVGWAHDRAFGVGRTTDAAKTFAVVDLPSAARARATESTLTTFVAQSPTIAALVREVPSDPKCTKPGGCAALSVWHTEDGGEHFASTTMSMAESSSILSIDAYYTDARHLWVVVTPQTGHESTNWLFWSEDGGASFGAGRPVRGHVVLPRGQREAWATNVCCADGEVARAATLVHTIDAGQAWKPVALPVPADWGYGVDLQGLAFDGKGRGIISALKSVGDGHDTLLVLETLDDGKSWRMTKRLIADGHIDELHVSIDAVSFQTNTEGQSKVGTRTVRLERNGSSWHETTREASAEQHPCVFYGDDGKGRWVRVDP
jgi:hypothetical protein